MILSIFSALKNKILRDLPVFQPEQMSGHMCPFKLFLEVGCFLLELIEFYLLICWIACEQDTLQFRVFKIQQSWNALRVVFDFQDIAVNRDRALINPVTACYLAV